MDTEGRSTSLSLPAAECRTQALTWAADEPRLSAVLLYGSVVRGTDNAYSDLDLVIVARKGERPALWQERDALAEHILGGEVVWSQELPWQRPYRYQAWRIDLRMVDLTFDQERAEPWYGLAEGFEALVDHDGVADRRRRELSAWRPPEFDAHSFDGGTWAWFSWLAGRLVSGEHWLVRAGIYDTLNSRVVPLLGASPYNVEQRLSPQDVQALTSAAPRSSDSKELLRSLQATVALYDNALDRWSERTSKERPHNPLAPAIRQRIAASTS